MNLHNITNRNEARRQHPEITRPPCITILSTHRHTTLIKQYIRLQIYKTYFTYPNIFIIYVIL